MPAFAAGCTTKTSDVVHKNTVTEKVATRGSSLRKMRYEKGVL